ncbi:hypothetical protein GCM10011588_03490 [Nocardia jinanensis]|uniref:Uncharacterized protein n=1 Tax=Nocardia jinanensis TaxID=382504 RepID=A0A917R639_9NOCA|nr:hypothetical protein GCM10011588_03490 [Nocardia jinanensis]
MHKCMDISPGDDTTLWCQVSRNPPGMRPTTRAERDAEMMTYYSSQSFAPFDKEVRSWVLRISPPHPVSWGHRSDPGR